MPTNRAQDISTALLCEDITKTYAALAGEEDRVVLDGASFEANSGEFVCILGPSGCGKSTFLNILSGLDRDFSGIARINGIDVQSPAIYDIRSAYVFQESRLLPWRTVEGNLEFALQAAGFNASEWPDRIEHYLSMVGLLEHRALYPGQLSGGMQQRTSIARAFCIEPDVLFMDEPFSALDEISARSLREDLLRIWEKQRMTVLFVTHNAHEAAFLADRILIMKRGPHSTFKDEIRLDELTRPRAVDDQAVFDASRAVVQRLMNVIG